MLSRNFILILCFITISFSQNSMSGYGYGSAGDESDSSSLGVSNKLLPSFKDNISLSNPSTWHNLLFTYLHTSVDVQNARYQSNQSSNFSLSSLKLIVPWKQKMSFGISLEPYLSREISISDTTMTSYQFNEEDLLYTRINNSSGGPSLGKMSFGYKLNDFDNIGSSLSVIFGSSRSSRKLIINDEEHLLQSRDYFNGSMIDIYYSTNRLKIKEKTILLSLNYQLPIGGIDVENDSYQAFLDLNGNNYHDTNDFPDVGQALFPLTQKFENEIKIRSFVIGADYEFSPRKHVQVEMLYWKDNGNHNLNTSVFDGYIENKNKLSISLVRFAEPFSSDRYNFKGSLFFQDYAVKNLENINEIGLGLGLGINFGITGNQIDFGYKLAKRDGLFLVGDETLHSFNVGVSIGDLWFVKRREI